MKKILVTGSEGYFGSFLVPYLKKKTTMFYLMILVFLRIVI